MDYYIEMCVAIFHICRGWLSTSTPSRVTWPTILSGGVLLSPLSNIVYMDYERRVHTMLKIGKVGMAIVMGLMLSMTLLASGAFAQDTTTTQNAASSVTRVASLTADIQQRAQQVLPTSNVQQLAATQGNYWCRGGNCWRYRYRRPIRFYRRYGGYRCYWARRGWGRWARTVRVCRRW